MVSSAHVCWEIKLLQKHQEVYELLGWRPALSFFNACSTISLLPPPIPITRALSLVCLRFSHASQSYRLCVSPSPAPCPLTEPGLRTMTFLRKFCSRCFFWSVEPTSLSEVGLAGFRLQHKGRWSRPYPFPCPIVFCQCWAQEVRSTSPEISGPCRSSPHFAMRTSPEAGEGVGKSEVGSTSGRLRQCLYQ